MKTVKDITDGGAAKISGLEIYIVVTIGEVECLIPVVMTDEYGNAHKILRRNIGNELETKI